MPVHRCEKGTRDKWRQERRERKKEGGEGEKRRKINLDRHVSIFYENITFSLVLVDSFSPYKTISAGSKRIEVEETDR